MTDVGKRAIMYGAIAAALMSVVTLATVVFESDYRPALRGEVVQVSGLVRENSINILLAKIDSNQRDIWAVQDRIEQFKAEGRATGALRDRLRDLEATREDLRRRLKRLEDN